MLIGSNTADSVRPSNYASGMWAYSLFTSYGTGTYVPSYSQAGAFVIASSGGHDSPPNLDAVIFDFTDATWKRLANANGIAPRQTDYQTSETNGGPYYEVNGATAGQIPSASHLYSLNTYIPPALGGGPKGSYLKLGSSAVTVSSLQGPAIHKMDLTTGLWTRITSGLNFGWNYEGSAVFDEAAGRWYFVPDRVHTVSSLQYLDAADWKLKNTANYPAPAAYDTAYQVAFLHPGYRLLIVQMPGSPLRALDLNNVGAGWVTLNTSGAQPGSANRWAYYPADGRFYIRANSSGQTLTRLTPPPFANWKSGTWTYDTVSIGGATIPNYTTTYSDGARHYSAFFYVPYLDCLAWVSGESTKVTLIKPPG